MPKIVLTTGSYDLLHPGHIRMLKRARSYGDMLIVGLATDEFNTKKGKRSILTYEQRKEVLEAVKYVNLVVPEDDWDSKGLIVKKYYVTTYVIGDDWLCTCDWLKDQCDVVYLPRTPNISTTQLKGQLK